METKKAEMIGLGIDLTHRCNLRCTFCWKFVEISKYEMTLKQVKNFCRYFRHLRPVALRITGGEPLMHPNFKKIIHLLMDSFPFSTMQILTNGLLLNDSMFHERVRYVVTPYLENEEIRIRYKDKITVYPRPHGYFDRNHDPNLSEKQARVKHHDCLYKQIRVIGDSVYDCCHAQTMERFARCLPVHVKVGENWQQEFDKMDNWQECVHCFVGDGGKKI